MRKVVLTGGSCSGKTTLIKELKQRGFPVLEEAARQILEECGTPFYQEGWIELEKKIYQRQIENEKRIDRQQGVVFLDGGMGDIDAFMRHYLGQVLMDVAAAPVRRYSSVFILDQLPFEDDGLRVESGSKESEEIHQKVIESYKSLGYAPIQIPIFQSREEVAIKQRADLLLKYLDE
jgi:predicted ATPase